MVSVSDAWSFSQLWVYLALILFLTGSVVFGAAGAEKKIKAVREAGKVEGDEYSRVQGLYMRSAWLSMAVFASVVILMVFKPGV